MVDKMISFFQKDNVEVLVKAVDLGDGTYALDTMSGKSVIATAELKRPADTTPYAINDAVSNSTTGANVTMLEFASVARFAGGGGVIQKLRMLTDNKLDVAFQYRLHLYHTPPAAAARIADNALYTLLYANRAIRVGYIDIGPMSTEDAAASDSAAAIVSNGAGNLPMAFKCAASDTKLYGLLEIKGALTPVSEQNYFFELTVMQD